MRLYGGIDLHSNNSVIHLIDENGVSHFRKRVANDLENMVALLTPYRDSLIGLVVESTYN
jgi:transposase